MILLAIALVAAPSASAAVVEALTYSTYEVNVGHGLSISGALENASPHRQDGRTFYGFTTWNVQTTFQFLSEPEGLCRIAKMETRLNVNIDLPRLVGADSHQEKIFDAFPSALRVHELGHYAIGKAAAAAVDAKLAALPARASCQALATAAGLAHTEIMREFEARGAAYDVETDHGQTQGAWLKGLRQHIQANVMPSRSS